MVLTHFWWRMEWRGPLAILIRPRYLPSGELFCFLPIKNWKQKWLTTPFESIKDANLQSDLLGRTLLKIKVIPQKSSLLEASCRRAPLQLLRLDRSFIMKLQIIILLVVSAQWTLCFLNPLGWMEWHRSWSPGLWFWTDMVMIIKVFFPTTQHSKEPPNH